MRSKKRIIVLLMTLLCSLLCLSACKSEKPQGLTNVDAQLARYILLDCNELTIETGDSYQLTATLKNSDATILWTSGNPDIATVNADGLITAVGAGETEILAKSSEDDTVFAPCTVTVVDYDRAPSLVVNYKQVILENGNTLTLTPTVRYKNGVLAAQYSYESLNEAIATVNANGVITAKSVGETKINVFARGEDYQLSASVDVVVRAGIGSWTKLQTKIVVPEADTGEEIFAVNKAPTLTCSLVRASDNSMMSEAVEVEYFIDDNGTWTPTDKAVSAGTYKVKYTYAGNEIYEGAEKEVEFKIFDDKGYLRELLKMKDSDSLALFTSNTTGHAPSFTPASGTTPNYVRVSVQRGGGATYYTTIDLQSLYRLKDVAYVKITYSFLSGYAYDVAFSINGIATNDNYSSLNLYKGSAATQTFTVTNAALKELGMADDTYLESIAFMPFKDQYIVLYVQSIDIVTVDEADAERETQRVVLDELLKMDSADSATLFASNTTGHAASFTSESGTNSVRVNVQSSGGSTYYTTLDLQSLYPLKDVENIKITYSMHGDCSRDVTLKFNNSAEVTLAASTATTTLTITKAQLTNAGLKDEDWLSSIVFWPTGDYTVIYLESIDITLKS